MDIEEFFKLILRKKKLITYFVLVFFTISAVFTLIQPFEYEARTRIMIVQTFEHELEPYSIAKSNQYLSSIITNVITSNSFYDKIIDSKFNVNKDYFYSSNKSELDLWRSTVKVGAVDDTGIINLEVFHTNKYQAGEISKALVSVIKNNYQEYYKVNHVVEIKVLDKVQVSNIPVRPNVLLNLSFGFLFGLLAGLCYIYLFAERFQEKVNQLVQKRNIVNKRLKKRSRDEIKSMNSKVIEKTAEKVANIGQEVAEIVQESNYKKQQKPRSQVKRQRRMKKAISKVKYNQADYNKIVKKGNIDNLFG